MEVCPRCTSDHVSRPSFTWWGGAVGAAVLCHRVCRLCRFGFSARSGTSNRSAVIAYVLVSNTIVWGIASLAERLLP